jgi:hypothetical protein
MSEVETTGGTTTADPAVLRLVELVTGMREQLDRVERRVGLGVVKETYTTEEVAERISRSEWTVRQWCNKGQVRGRKVRGRGRQGEWRIPHDELVRVQNEGPLPPAVTRTTA